MDVDAEGDARRHGNVATGTLAGGKWQCDNCKAWHTSSAYQCKWWVEVNSGRHFFFWCELCTLRYQHEREHGHEDDHEHEHEGEYDNEQEQEHEIGDAQPFVQEKIETTGWCGPALHAAGTGRGRKNAKGKLRSKAAGPRVSLCNGQSIWTDHGSHI